VTDKHRLLLLLAMVATIYGARMGTMPLRGEESRWAHGAALMIETGDWIVPRQQLEVFPERPPLGSWAMAVVGLVRGEVDVVAVRLPSVVAVVLTTWLVFVYARTFLGGLGALAAAAGFATMGQVLQIGRLGESEAVFTLFVSASLLLWHLGYVRRWPAVSAWTIGYACAALGALTKGLQAPLYFMATTTVFLAWNRDWRTWLSWSHAAGLAVFAAIVGAWQVPFCLMTDAEAVVAVWTGLVGDRLGLAGLLSHLAKYPLETFVCTLPWSPLVLQLVSPRLRRSLYVASGHVTFLLVAIAVTYPTVWFSVGARGRYYMPLYPCIAVLLGLIVERSVRAPLGSFVRGGWSRFLIGVAAACAAGGLVVAGAGLTPALERIVQPPLMAVAFGAAGLAAAAVALWACKGADRRAEVAIYAITAFVGLAYTGVVINVMMAGWDDLAERVAEARSRLPAPERLVSFGAIHHRFCYYYGDTIAQLRWPERTEDVPAGVDYFCFAHHRNDTPQRRAEGRGRTWSTTPGTLPFAWQEIARVPCESRLRSVHHNTVIIGRIIGPTASDSAQAAASTPRTALREGGR